MEGVKNSVTEKKFWTIWSIESVSNSSLLAGSTAASRRSLFDSAVWVSAA
jgi:hypothetical protein